MPVNSSQYWKWFLFLHHFSLNQHTGSHVWAQQSCEKWFLVPAELWSLVFVCVDTLHQQLHENQQNLRVFTFDGLFLRRVEIQEARTQKPSQAKPSKAKQSKADGTHLWSKVGSSPEECLAAAGSTLSVARCRLVCQYAEERKRPTVRAGEKGKGEGKKKPPNCESTTPACRCGGKADGDRAGGSEQRVPAEAERAAAVRGRTSAGVVLTSPAAESDWTKERSAGSLFKQRGGVEEGGPGMDGDGGASGPELEAEHRPPKVYCDPPRGGEIQEATEAGVWLTR